MTTQEAPARTKRPLIGGLAICLSAAIAGVGIIKGGQALAWGLAAAVVVILLSLVRYWLITSFDKDRATLPEGYDRSGEPAFIARLERRPTRLIAPWHIVAGIIAALIASASLSGLEASPASACKDAARDRLAGPDSYTTVTFTDGNFIKGIVGEYRGGRSVTTHHWEGQARNGGCTLTFTSEAE